MTSERPQVTLDGHYSVKDASNALGISRRSMERYMYGYVDRKGVRRPSLIKFHTNRANHLFVMGRDLIRFWEGKA